MPSPRVAEAESLTGGALAGLRVIEFAGLGPVPFAAMLLADHGADVIRLERPGASFDPQDPVQRNRRSVCINLKSEQGLALAMKLAEQADVVLEGFRPGVMERLGLGPEPLLERNPGLIFGRLSGWGQHGPMADQPGRDINYLSLTGILAALGAPDQPPPPPLNLVGDYGGGAMMFLAGLLMALLARGRTGKGQVVDASILAGSNFLSAWVRGQVSANNWENRRGANLLDGGAPFYRCYACACGNWVAVGAIDPGAYASLMDLLEFDSASPLRGAQFERSQWPRISNEIAERFARQSRAAWLAGVGDGGPCVTPVLNFEESAEDPHVVANQLNLELDAVIQPAPAPSLSATPAPPVRGPVQPGTNTREVLENLGLDDAAIARLFEDNVVA